MNARETLHALADTLPEEDVARLVESASKRKTYDKMKDETPEELLARIGTWEDERPTEEIIQDIYHNRSITGRADTVNTRIDPDPLENSRSSDYNTFQDRLKELGLIQEVKPRVNGVETYKTREPLPIVGKPLSEQLIEERR
jgi:hypothetical protein